MQRFQLLRIGIVCAIAQRIVGVGKRPRLRLQRFPALRGDPGRFAGGIAFAVLITTGFGLLQDFPIKIFELFRGSGHIVPARRPLEHAGKPVVGTLGIQLRKLA